MQDFGTIPAIIRVDSQEQNSRISIIENVQRENLHPIEKAKGYQSLLDQFDFTVQELAKNIGKNPAQVGETLSILDLAPQTIKLLEKQSVPETLCKILLEVTDPELQYEMALYIIEDGLSVPEARKRLNIKKIKKNPALAMKPIYKEIEDRFTNYFGTKTKLKMSATSADKGQIVIKYNSNDDLERILGLLK